MLMKVIKYEWFVNMRMYVMDFALNEFTPFDKPRYQNCAMRFCGIFARYLFWWFALILDFYETLSKQNVKLDNSLS